MRTATYVHLWNNFNQNSMKYKVLSVGKGPYRMVDNPDMRKIVYRVRKTNYIITDEFNTYEDEDSGGCNSLI